MVRELERKRQSARFPESAPAANPVFFRTYSRRTEAGLRETWDEVCDRTLKDLIELGKLSPEEVAILDKTQRNLTALPSGRWLWVGGTDWINKSKNFSGAYNCTSTNLQDWKAFGLMMNLAMMGCGTGAVIEPGYINQLPPIRNRLNIIVKGEIGTTPKHLRREYTQTHIEGNSATIYVGDSREGWVESYQTLLELSTDERFTDEVQVFVDVSDVRQSGETLNGFGGVANPVKLPGLYQRCAAILNKALGRKLNSVECCLLIDEGAVTIVAGNIRRSAGMRQFISDDQLGATAKDNLWQQDENGRWRIDPERDSLRMANHTRVFHRKPTLEECVDAVRKQYYSGEGAIQWAGEAVARANIDLLPTQALKVEFLKAYEEGTARDWLQKRHPDLDANELEHRLARYGLNPCVTADTWVHTEQGARQVKDLIGKQLSVYVNGELFSTTTEGFWFTGVKPILKVITQEGYELRLTGNHQLLKVTAQTQKKQYSEWVETQDLSPGDYILVHNHREIQPWDSFGTFDEGWLLGNLIGDGSIASTQWGKTAYLRYWQDSQQEMGKYAVTLLKNAVNYSGNTDSGCYHQQLKHRVINSSGLAKLAANYGVTLEHKMPTDKIEQASYEFYRGFLRGLFDADGSVQGNQQKGVSVRLAQSNLKTLQIVQRMLARLGIISAIYQERRPEAYRLLPNSNRELELYSCKAQHELVISNDNLYLFEQIVGFQEPQKSTRLQELLGGYKRKLNRERFAIKVKQIVSDGLEAVYDCTVPGASQFDANGIVAHNCGEIIGSDFHCNLSEIHLNQIDPFNYKEQEEAFTAGALSVATLLNHQFPEPRYQYSRELDPIVGVSFTGLFDFFVHAFGAEWLQWWEAGRPATPQGLAFKREEEKYLSSWREIVQRVVWDYCDRHNIKRPNRCTTVQPSGTKSLLTGASPGWHPPKAQRFIRRITFRKNDPVALACIDYGYNVIPSQSDKDEQGNLLNDPLDPRVSEWLVEIPVAVSWADIPGADTIDISKFNAIAQMDFYMQVQKFYVTHNTSATIEVREHEVETLGEQIWQAIQNDEGYISAALLARFDDHQTFPRLPFEPISKAQYEQMVAEVVQRRKTDDFYAVLSRYDFGDLMEVGPAGCDSDKCMMPEQSPN
ncbi:ribonucleoside-triphosphate reductase, adenosylcobalamin-dependent [Nostoc parmelioides]|uniref:Ribonucleoside-triphosphate reductase, adenosylcobalamin-dependent n=1 Tax=Nostoc parmelioides FACHB-3921 TaxID=2692909 RepID=A0ABR8BQA0_9NOSO|nr:ribonucleoside-triphosphate reductase, adenosylcobalamin-dependent [Nostoc parmelioides]MBD2255799.1 ribonucleoside-triphosphate reductase, adenosylcobalamin-dependent [Nostoc parmelioides FACHB-3921]